MSVKNGEKNQNKTTTGDGGEEGGGKWPPNDEGAPVGGDWRSMRAGRFFFFSHFFFFFLSLFYKNEQRERRASWSWGLVRARTQRERERERDIPAGVVRVLSPPSEIRSSIIKLCAPVVVRCECIWISDGSEESDLINETTTTRREK